MVIDQFFDVKNGGTVNVPDAYRGSYRDVIIYLMAHNYTVPPSLQEKADAEADKPRTLWP